MERRKVKFINNGACCIPCIKVTLKNGNQAVAILDSGSDTSLISEDFAKDNADCVTIYDTGCSMSFSGLYGEGKKELIKAETKLEFDKGCKRTAVMSVVDLTFVKTSFLKTYNLMPDILFGSDFFDYHDVQIDYKNSCIEI